MALLQITEFERLAVDGQQQGGPFPSVDGNETFQSVTYTTAAQSAAFQSGTRFVRLCGAADAYVAFGANPTATVASMMIPADTPTLVGIHGANVTKLSVYDGSS